MSSLFELKPWTKVAVPHEDILGGDFDLSSYAANLGQVDTRSEKCPAVYKDPVSFFNATYMTKALDELLRDVANVLSGGAGNRVLQLRTPFGGGKTHTLIALLHLVRNRDALHGAKLIDGYPDPGPGGRVAVLPCLDLGAAGGRKLDGGVHLRTLWGELAWRLGGADAYEAVREADQLRVNPGGGALRKILDGKPTLILMDEVLTYVEAANGVPVGGTGEADHRTDLGRQTMLFMQHLTEVVRGLPHCAMAYSLQQSVREAVGDEGLLDMLDALVSRLDAKKEPVTGDEVLRVVQRRLFQDLGKLKVRETVAREYGRLLTSSLAADAQTDSEQRAAKDQGEALRTRILECYPFHPELLDLMYHRWGSLPSYQRTRGALQFLATVIGALWKNGDSAGALIGPGDVPLIDNMVRNTFFSQVGEREQMKSVLDSDLLGVNARCKRIDDAMAADVPTLQSFRVGTRLTRALALYSFGAKPGEDRGVLRSDLLGAVQLPGLTSDVLDVALQSLTETLLYVHSSGRRFRFDKKPNLNKLIEEEVRKIEGSEVLVELRKEFEQRLDAHTGFVIWPKDSGAVTDKRARFHVVFLGPEHALASAEELEKLALDWTENCGGGKRSYRNALAFALPSASAVDRARLAARKRRAIDQLLRDKSRYGFDKEDVEDLDKRKRRASDDLLASARQMYPVVLLPVPAPPSSSAPIKMQRFDIQSYQALGSGLLSSIYRVLENWVFETAVPGKLVSCTHLGEGDLGTRGHWISGPELTEQFFGSVHYPKLLTLKGLKATVAKGVTRGTFGYVMGAQLVDGKLRPNSKDCLTIKEEVEPDDIDLSEGSWVVSKAQADAWLEAWKKKDKKKDEDDDEEQDDEEEEDEDDEEEDDDDDVVDDNTVRLEFRANGPQLFQAFSALQVLTELADEEFVASVHIYGKSSGKLDRNTYEMSVVMSLEEADIDIVKS